MNGMQALTGQHCSPGVALLHLDKMFNGSERRVQRKGTTVVLLDEMDMLVTRSQQVEIPFLLHQGQHTSFHLSVLYNSSLKNTWPCETEPAQASIWSWKQLC